MRDNTAGMLAYFLIPAVFFLTREPYKKNVFVRFHSIQSLCFGAAVVLSIMIVAILLALDFSLLLVVPLSFMVVLGSFIVWLLLIIKASQGLMFKLPLIGVLAEKQANP